MGLYGDLAERALSACTGVMGELVTIFPVEGEAYSARGVFDDDHTDVATEEATPVSTTGPMVSFQESRLAARLRPDDELEVRARRYVVVDVQQDGLGTIDCILNDLGDAEESP